jgi:hypothetical protein
VPSLFADQFNYQTPYGLQTLPKSVPKISLRVPQSSPGEDPADEPTGNPATSSKSSEASASNGLAQSESNGMSGTTANAMSRAGSQGSLNAMSSMFDTPGTSSSIAPGVSTSIPTTKTSGATVDYPGQAAYANLSSGAGSAFNRVQSSSIQPGVSSPAAEEASLTGGSSKFNLAQMVRASKTAYDNPIEHEVTGGYEPDPEVGSIEPGVSSPAAIEAASNPLSSYMPGVSSAPTYADMMSPQQFGGSRYVSSLNPMDQPDTETGGFSVESMLDTPQNSAANAASDSEVPDGFLGGLENWGKSLVKTARDDWDSPETSPVDSPGDAGE